MPAKSMSSTKAVLIFTTVTVYFFMLLYMLLPFLKTNFSLNPALYWFIIGYFLFIPLFVYAIMMSKREGAHGFKEIKQYLKIKPMSKRDWKYAIGGLLLVFAFTGLVFGVSLLLHKWFGVRMLKTTPWFMEIHPFRGSEILLLLIWLPMFFFNIVGEEVLWRGYIQARLKGKYSWLLCALMWWLFHLPFGIDLMIMAVAAILIVPYLFKKTGNTSVGIFIHGVYNGPIFVLITLGLVH